VSGELPPSAALRWRPVATPKDSGQSSVVRVERIADGVRGVLKVPSAAPDQRERLARETRLLEQLSHPSIVRLLDYNLEPNDQWLVTPLGTPLPDWWKQQRGALHVDERARVARLTVLALLEGLAVVHREGIVHRDIKPPNVILDGSQPKLIDFGIAYAPDDERLTDLNHPVANKFAAPAAAYYGPIDHPKPWWDCLGIAWLWGWMLTHGPLPKDARYHWKYHRMIECDDADRIRAVLAVCSDESTSPPDAEAMRRLLTMLGLSAQEPQIQGEHDANTFANALELQTRQLKVELIEKQTRRERTEAAALVLAPIYEDIRGRMRGIARSARAAGLPVDISALLNDHPIAISMSALKEQRQSVTLFECRCTPAKGVAFRITLQCEHRELLAGGWPFYFTLTIRPGPGYRDNDVLHLTDGTPLVNFGCSKTTNDLFPGLLQKWLNEPAHWQEFSV
jgi:serine/threonine protein kinase